MIAELGHFALVLAMMVAIAQSIVPMIGAYQNNIPWMRFGNHSAMGQFLLVAISFGLFDACLCDVRFFSA